MTRRKKSDTEIVVQAANLAAPIFRWCGWKWTTHNPDDRDEKEVPSAARIAATLLDLVADLRADPNRGAIGTGRFVVELCPETGDISIRLELCTLDGPSDWEAIEEGSES